MKLVYVIAGGEILLALFTGVYLSVGLALSETPVPLWLAVVVAVVYAWACLELLRHALGLLRWWKELDQ